MQVVFAVMAAVACLTAPMVVSGQTFYRCGSTFSQTPCGADQKKVEINTVRDCDLDANKYLEACLRSSSARPKQLVEPNALAEFRSQKLDLAERRNRPPPPERVVRANKKACESAVRSLMKDPEAAQIRDVTRLGPSLDYVSAERTIPAVDYLLYVNGKNSYGGYIGEKPWVCVFDPEEARLLRVKDVGSNYLTRPWYDD